MLLQNMRLMQLILFYVTPYKKTIYFLILCASLTGLFSIFHPYLIKLIIIDLEKDQGLQYAFWPAIFFILNFEMNNLGWRGINYCSYKIKMDLKKKIISHTFDYVLQHSHSFFQNNLSGKIASNINILAENIEKIIFSYFHHFIRGFIVLIGALASMFLVNQMFFISLLVWAIIFFSVSVYISKNIVKLANQQADKESEASGQLIDCINNNQNIYLFSRRSNEKTHILIVFNHLKKAFQNKEFYLIKFNLLQGLSLTLMFGVMMYILFKLKHQNLITTGDFALILTLCFEVGFSTWWVIEQIDFLNNSIGKCKQSMYALFKPLEIIDIPDAQNLRINHGEIVFDAVNFHYKESKPLFQNKSITIHPKTKVGLVGYSGSGKSTFVNLILRMFDVNTGRILIDNQNIREITQDSLRNAIGMIPQEPSLFHRSIRENIRYGKLGASDEEVINSAKRAHADEFIVKLSEGYNALVGERGIKLSGGQRQRIAIARAILKNAPILILDEATSQLDSVTESLIQASLWDLMENKTTIVIAHRLSTLQHMDRILVFDKGQIVEDGTHLQLLNQNGLYKTLWDTQVGGFIKDEMETAD